MRPVYIISAYIITMSKYSNTYTPRSIEQHILYLD